MIQKEEKNFNFENKSKITTKLIAEIGLNHCGSLDRAINLCDLAISSGADFLKFQYFKSENLFHIEEYKKILNLNNNFKQDIDKILLNDSEFIKLLKYCIDKNYPFGISFFSNYDLKNLKDSFYLETNKPLFENISFLKVASGEVNDIPLLKEYLEIGINFNKPILISVGATSDNEIKFLLNFFNNIKKNIVLLHCRMKYPADFNNFNLQRIEYLRKKFKVKTGISDHSIGIEIPLLSLQFNPEYIEKHFTDDRNNKIADNPMSTTTNEFAIIKEIIKNYNSIIGNGKFNLLENEKNEIKFARKGLYLLKDKNKDEQIFEEDIISLRPNLIVNDAFNYKKIVFKKLNKDKIKFSHIDIYKDIY